MELRLYLHILGIHKKLLLLMCLSATLTAILITYVISEKFRATAVVLVQPTENLELSKSGRDLLGFPFPVTYSDPIKTINQTYTDLIKSRPIIEKVVGELGLQLERQAYEPNSLRRIWKTSKKEAKQLLQHAWFLLLYGRIERSDPVETAVSKVAKGLSASPVKDTYLLEISGEFEDPRVAAAIANTAARAFIDYNHEISSRRAGEVKEFVKERKDISERELIGLREALKQFKKNNNIALLRKETELKLSSLTDFEESMQKTENSLKEVAASAEKTQQQLAREESYLRSSTTVGNNPLVLDLKAQLSSLETERAGLLQKLSPSHRDVTVVQAKIDSVQKKLQEESARTVDDESTILNPVHENLRKELMSLESQKDSLLARRTALLSDVERYRGDLKSVAAKEAQLSDLELRVQVAENNFAHLSQEYEDMRLNEAKRVSEIRIVQAATPPVYPVRPLKILYAGTSLLVSLLVAVCIAFLLEYANLSIRNAREAEEALNLPMLSVIPAIQAPRGAVWPLLQPAALFEATVAAGAQHKGGGPKIQGSSE